MSNNHNDETTNKGIETLVFIGLLLIGLLLALLLIDSDTDAGEQAHKQTGPTQISDAAPTNENPTTQHNATHQSKTNAAATDKPLKKTTTTETVKAKENWKLIDERKMSGRLKTAAYLPYYQIQSGESGLHYKQKVIQWRHYSDEDLVPYHIDEEYLLDASRVFDRWIQISERAPHTLRWRLRIKPLYQSTSLMIVDQGLVVGADPFAEGISLFQDDIYDVLITRANNSLHVIVNNKEELKAKISEQDRTPLRLTAQIKPLTVLSSRLEFAADEDWSDPPARPTQGPALWETYFAESFSHQASITHFNRYDHLALLNWDKQAQSLSFDPTDAMSSQIFVMLRHSLPGDMRVSFRARSMMENQPPFFGVLVNLKGALKKEAGYFLEWNYWQVQIKKNNVRKAGKSVSYKKPYRNKQWMSVRFEKHQGKFTLHTDDVEVLSWTDSNTYNDNGHDMLAFYSWKVPMQIDDLVIERNLNDKLKPREDHPAFVENYLDDLRDSSIRTEVTTHHSTTTASEEKPAAGNLDDF